MRAGRGADPGGPDRCGQSHGCWRAGGSKPHDRGRSRMSIPKRRFWGWGVEGAGPNREQQEKIGQTIAARFGATPREPIEPPAIDELDLRAPRVVPPAALEHL